jgi:membrane protein
MDDRPGSTQRTVIGALIGAAAVVWWRRSQRRREASSEEADNGDRAGSSPAAAGPRVPRWRQIADTVRVRIKQENVPITAAGLAFYAFLALIPGLIAVVTAYGLIADPTDVERLITDLADVLPDSARNLIEDELQSIVSAPSAGLGMGLAIALGAALWSASGGMAALIKGINGAFGEEETRGFLALRGLSLGLTLGAIAFVVAAGFGTAALPLVLEGLGLGGVGRTLLEWGRWPVILLAVAAGIAVLYRVAPDRSRPPARWFNWGTLIAALVWLVATAGFSFYVSSFGSYSQTYGVLAGVVVLLLWFYLSGFALLLGALIEAEVETGLR